MSSELYRFSMRRIDGTEAKLSEFENRVLLIVNVASECGLTPQYDGLEKLYDRFQNQGFEVLGFPANEFGAQEPGSNTEIHEFCRSKYGVLFPMFEKIVVKGAGQHPLYAYLTKTCPKARFKPDSKILKNLEKQGTEDSIDIHWNFEKFLVNRRGDVVARFSPDVEPTDSMITEAIEAELKKK